MTDLKGTLCVDIHEPQSIIDVLRTDLPPIGIAVEVSRYDAGDYFIGNKLGIERKSPDDFVGSIGDGRIFQQARELRDNFSTPIIVVDGTLEQVCTHRHAFSYANVYASVMSLYVHANVPVFFCGPGSKTNPNGSILAAIKGLAAKAVSESTGTYTPIRRGATTKERQLSLVMSLPKVGEVKARRILKRYRNPMAAFHSVDKWAEDLDGFGKTISESARSVLNDDSPVE